MSKRTCEADGCTAPHVARGLCRRHYKVAHEMHDVACVTCGKEYRSARATGKYCSDDCKGDAYRIRVVSQLPRDHPVMVLMRESRRPKHTLTTFECGWCGSMTQSTKTRQRFCSPRCKLKAKRVRRRGREHGAIGTYTWAEVTKVLLKFDRCCAYCETRIVGLPDPDHVIPLSRGGANSLTNILPSCRQCNGDKRDLLLDEWVVDREQRGLPPRIASWALDDPRVRHLTCLAHPVAA